MNDPGVLWCVLSNRFWQSSIWRLAREFDTDVAASLIGTALWMPILVNDGFFDVHPLANRAAKRTWHWVLAARYRRVADHDRRTRQLCAMFGENIFDLVACTPDLRNVVARLVGGVDVIGWPIWPGLADPYDEPIRVHETPLAWARAGCDGVVLVGDESSVQEWLRGCEPGIVADSLAHGEALLRKMMRPVPRLPKVLVAQ